MVEANDFFFKNQLGFSLGTGKVLQFAWLPFHLGYTTRCARKSRREDRGVMFHQGFATRYGDILVGGDWKIVMVNSGFHRV